MKMAMPARAGTAAPLTGAGTARAPLGGLRRLRPISATRGGTATTYENERVDLGDKKGGQVECEVFYPSTRDAHHAVVFLHGFAQGPLAYSSLLGSLASQGYLVVAPTAGFFRGWEWLSWITPDREAMQLELQEALSRAGLAAANAISDGHPALAEYTKNGRVDRRRIGLAGHSLGGALSPWLASKHEGIKAMTLLAPFPAAQEEYDPETVLNGGSPSLGGVRSAQVLSGGLDLVARNGLLSLPYADIHEAIVKPLEDKEDRGMKLDAQGLVGLRKLWTHSGYQDQIQVGSLKLRPILGGVAALIPLAAAAFLWFGPTEQSGHVSSLAKIIGDDLAAGLSFVASVAKMKGLALAQVAAVVGFLLLGAQSALSTYVVRQPATASNELNAHFDRALR